MFCAVSGAKLRALLPLHQTQRVIETEKPQHEFLRLLFCCLIKTQYPMIPYQEEHHTTKELQLSLIHI